MKTYLKLLEDIELVSGVQRTTRGDMAAASEAFHDSYGPKPKNLGKIHKNYSIHSRDGNFFITHDKTKKVVGHIADDGRSSKSKTIGVGMVLIDKNHTKKKIGHSIAVAAYKHLHKKGYTIHSGTEQSAGGAAVWRELMKDKATSKHVHAMHKDDWPLSRAKSLGQASKLHTGDIWTSGSGETRRMATKKGIRMHKYGTPESEKAYGTTLVLKAKK
jgi:hypothetical protein